MPTMSSLRSKPSFTPDTMLAIRARVRPWSARILRSSSGRPMTSTPPSSVAESGDGMGWLSLPFGPSARTTPSPTWTFTPWGIGMGFLPMRDMSGSLPHVGEDFAADLLLACLAIGHHALGRRDERAAHAGEQRWDRCACLPARLRDARHLALEGELAEAQAAHLELADEGARAPAQLAAVVAARLELRRPLRLHDEGGLRHNLIAP